MPLPVFGILPNLLPAPPAPPTGQFADAIIGIAAALYSPGILTFIPKGSFGDGIPIQATLEEVLHHTLEVTEHPIENGAAISDHSFVRPSEIIIHCGWSNSSLEALTGAISSLMAGGALTRGDYVAGVYSQLVRLQQTREPFVLTTGLRSYKNMLLTSITVTRDSKTSQALMVTATCREVLLVNTSLSTLPDIANQSTPANTADVANRGVTQVAPVVSPGHWVPF